MHLQRVSLMASFSSASSGSITLSGLANGAKCRYSIGVPISIANIRLTCSTISLGGTGGTTGVTVNGVKIDVNTPTLSGSKTATVNILNAAVGSTGAVTCNWDLGPPTTTFTTCTTTTLFTIAATGTITLTNLNPSQKCTFNIMCPNNEATILVKCTLKDLDVAGSTMGDVTANFDIVPITPVTTTGVTSFLNYGSITVLNNKAAGAATCDWSTIIP